MTAPTCVTIAPADPLPDSVHLVGRLKDDGGLPTNGYFEHEWGPLNARYTTAPLPVADPGDTFDSLTPGQTYRWIHRFRAVVSNADDIGYGEWQNFWLPLPTRVAEGSSFYTEYAHGVWVGRALWWFVDTDVACHLTAHISNEPPWKKRGAHFKRGKVFFHSPIVYWGWYFDLEQLESGDTTHHTFTYVLPSQMTEIWIQAIGTVDGKPSPSYTPFFQYIYTTPTYIERCYTSPLATWSFDTLHEMQYSFPLVASSSFYLDRIILYFTGHPVQPPLQYCLFLLYDADENYKPLEPPLAQSLFQIGAPLWPQPYALPCPVYPTWIQAGQRYAWALRFPTQSPGEENWRIVVQRGELGECNIIMPPYKTYRSLFTDGNWDPWTSYGITQAHYTMEETT